MSRAITHTTTVPAGDYFIGDPCYSIADHGEWMRWLEAGGYTTERIVEADLGGGRFAVGVGTAYGDGFYPDNKGRAFPVDAGMIGIVSTRWPGATAVEHPLAVETLRYRITLDEPTTITYRDGLIVIGDTVIETN